MNTQHHIICALFFFVLSMTTTAQNQNVLLENEKDTTIEFQSFDDKKFSIKIGVGYFRPFIDEEGVTYSNGLFEPEIGLGYSYHLSFDYSLSKDFSIGVGYNGSYAQADFIKNATVNDETIDGYLEAGAVTNSHILLNISYVPEGDNIKPFARLGLGYLTQQVENGDVPLRLTNNVETEIFPDFKSSGFGVLPEIGIRYNNFFLSAAYSLSFQDLTGEDNPDGFVSPGTVSSQGLQINIAYRIFIF